MITLTKGLPEVHIAVFLFGFAGLFGKFLTLSPISIVFGRTFFASLFLILFLLATKKLSKLSLKTILSPKLITQGILLAVHWVSFFKSIQVSSVATGLLSFSTFPVFVIMMEPIIFGSKVSRRNILLALCIPFGVLFLVPEFNLSGNEAAGVFYGVISALTFAILVIMNKISVKSSDPITVALVQNFYAALVLGPLTGSEVLQISQKDLVLIVILGVLCTAFAHTLFMRGLRHLTPHVASIITSLEPLYGITLAFILLGEIPAPGVFIGGTIILTACMKLKTTG